MHNVSMLVRTYAGNTNARAVLVVRHVQLAHVLAITGLSDEYDVDFYIGESYRVSLDPVLDSSIDANKIRHG